MSEQPATDQTEVTAFRPSSPSSKLNFDGPWQYDVAPQSSESIEIRDQYGLFIDGKFQEPEKGRYFSSINPATEEELSSIAEATQQDGDKTVKAAHKANVKIWSTKYTAHER